jgi:hypothetical protein
VAEMMEGIGIVLSKVGKDKCPICEKAPHPDRTTSDKKAGKGCLDSIPANLGCSPIAQDPGLPNYATAAHHIIPANQCLKAFKRLSQMCKTVGYNVNNSANGMPLPTCGQKHLNKYVASSGKRVKYGRLDDPDKQNVAFLIMEGLDKQWHVGHHNWSMDLKTDPIKHPQNYDRLVKTKLRDIEKDLAQDGAKVCNPKDGSESGSDVIGDLNGLSAEIKGKVSSWSKYFVSAMSCRFALKYR